jgi:hypothetical protein
MLATAMRVFSVLLAGAALLGVGASWSAGRARADDAPLRLMRDPTAFTDVIDAFDGADPFDLNAHLGYVHTSDRGHVQREYTDADSHNRKRENVANSEQITSTLMFGLDVGLYKDLMAFIRLPLILSDARSLSVPGGKSAQDINSDMGPLADPFNYSGATGGLFQVPFKSPTRAGFDYIGIGGAWSVLNQQRHSWQPTWTFVLEGRRAIGTPLKPCQVTGGKTVCGNIATGGQDIDGDGVPDGTADQFKGQSAGSSKGFSGISFETRLSRRYRYVEPYVGLGVLIQWASTAKKYFNPGGDLSGVINTLPSQQANATLGATIVPWENRGRFQRFALDLRFNTTYFSQGHDYSALYDALGTSDHAALARPNFEGVKGVNPDTSGPIQRCNTNDPSATNCYVGSKVPFYGLTDVRSHLKSGFRFGLDLQAASYIRFGLGTAVSWVTAHAITGADPCNQNVKDASRTEAYRGSTCGTGIVNPNHRPTIDLPGRRFWMQGEVLVDLYATATAQF